MPLIWNEPASAPKRWQKLTLLGALYFAQGLPFGFQAIALPLHLRRAGVPLTAIGLMGIVATPWVLKPLWAPLVDRFGSKRFGRRKSWIVPMQLVLAMVTGIAALVPSDKGLGPVLLMVFLMNFSAATLDIAVDGLAVDLLSSEDLGFGNAAQVVGYKAGMVTGGGLLVWASDLIGWAGELIAMVVLIAIVAVVTLRFREPPPNHEAVLRFQSIRAIVAAFVEAGRRPGARWVFLAVATYKVGESVVDAMFKPFLMDAGFSIGQIGLWIGTYGISFSILGSLAGGWMASRTGLLAALVWTAAPRVVSLAGVWWLAAAGPPAPAGVIAVTCADHFLGGALMSAMFAYMMSTVDRRIGATQYSVLAGLEAFGKSPGTWVSGALADAGGYGATFAVGTVLAALFLLLLPQLSRHERAERV